MFYEISGERFREVFKCEDGSWIISYDHPLEPRFVIREDMERLTRILPPAEYVRNKEKEPTAGQRKRIALLEESWMIRSALWTDVSAIRKSGNPLNRIIPQCGDCKCFITGH